MEDGAPDTGPDLLVRGPPRLDDKERLMRGPLRTIAVLRALNVRNGSTVGDLSKFTGISRPALYRILETLREAGYVSLSLSRQQYCLTMLVRTLAQGFTDEDWVVQVARPELSTLQRQVLWPVDLGTFMSNAMWIRETTRHASPLTIDRGVVGIRFPMLGGATGRAYLAFCPPDERKLILSNLACAPFPGDPVLESPARIEELLDFVRERGYGHRHGEPPTESGAIAVPIMLDQRILGCVNLTFMAKVLAPEEAAAKYLVQMRDAASRIVEGVRHLNDFDPGAVL